VLGNGTSEPNASSEQPRDTRLHPSSTAAYVRPLRLPNHAMQTYLSHCANCGKRTVTVWRNSSAYCSECGSSHVDMAQRGMNTAGPWDDCPFCQDRHYYELVEGELRCEECGLTIDLARAKDEARPSLISYRPTRVTSGALFELEYWSKNSFLPVMLSVSWLPQHGHTDVRLLTEDFPASTAVCRIAIEVPLSATSAVVVDRSGRSRKCEIPIDFISTPHSPRKRSLLRRFLGLN